MTRAKEDGRKPGQKATAGEKSTKPTAGEKSTKPMAAAPWPRAALELVLGLACPALGWAYLRLVAAVGGSLFSYEGPAYELLLVGWLACAVVGSVLGIVWRDRMRGNVAWRVGRAVCVAFLALFVAMLAVVAVFMVTFAKTKA